MRRTSALRPCDSMRRRGSTVRKGVGSRQLAAEPGTRPTPQAQSAPPGQKPPLVWEGQISQQRTLNVCAQVRAFRIWICSGFNLCPSTPTSLISRGARSAKLLRGRVSGANRLDGLRYRYSACISSMAGTSAVRATGPTARPAHASAHLIETDLNATFSSLFFLGRRDPTDPLVSCQRRDSDPEALRSGVRFDCTPEVGR
jgi:hypothetical protein